MKLKKLLILLASVTLFACVFVGCKKVENIDVLKKDMPQLVYVQGSELNLSSGKLTVEIKGEKVEIPLDDSSVTISGYDKNKLGEQVLTITYEEKTTTIKVTVVPRVVVEKTETNYFVGEAFNYEKGNLVITKDDGSSFKVPMNDETVSVTGFSSETPNASLPVTAKYQKDGVSYDATFNVTVHEVKTVEFRAPNKQEYQNHETALDVSGGYISLKNADQTFIRYQVLTADMVSGFDLSKATLANRETPLTQTLTVNFLGNIKTYDIQIHFSDLSLIRLRAKEMKDLKFTDAGVPTGCTEDMGENALEAMDVYFAMQDAEKTKVTATERDTLIKVASTYGLDKWKTAFESYKDAFYLKDGGLYWDCSNFEKTKAVYTRLLEKDPVVYEDALILTRMATDFADTVIVPVEDEDEEDITVGGILSAVYSTEIMDEFAGQLSLMITLYESLENVPKEWTSNDLKTTYKNDVESAWVILRETEYTNIRFRNLYTLASKWREKDDFFDILYDYYYDETNLKDGKVDLSKISAFKDFRLPGKLEVLYTYLYNAKTQAEYMLAGYQYKSEEFLFNYEKALKVQQSILTSGSDMEKDLYARLEFDYLISDGQGGYVLCSFDKLMDLFRRTEMGYLYHFNAYLDVPEFENLWAQVLTILDNVSVSGEAYYQTAEFGNAVESMLEEYLMLSPMQQVKFMSLLNPYYASMTGASFPVRVWDDSEGACNSFVFFVYKYYKSVLPESTHNALTQLTFAMESLSLSGISPNEIQNFTTAMQTVYDYLDAVDENDKNAFLAKLDWVYEPYYELATVKYADLDNPVKEDVGEWEDEIVELYTILAEAYFTVELNNAFTQSQQPTVILGVLAAYEKAEKIANQILNSGNESAIKAYYFDARVLSMVMPNGQTIPNFGGTLDFLMFYIRNAYAQILRSSMFTQGTLLLDYYNDINTENASGMDLKDYFADAHYIYYNFMYWKLIGDGEANHKYFADVDKMMDILTNFRTLSIDQQHYVVALDYYSMYRVSMQQFAKEQGLNSEAITVVNQLLYLEYIHVSYQKDPTGVMADEETTYLDLLDDELQTLLEDYHVLYEELEILETELSEMEEELNGTTPTEQQSKELQALKEKVRKYKESLNKFTTYFGGIYEYYLDKCEALGLNTTYPAPEPQN